MVTADEQTGLAKKVQPIIIGGSLQGKNIINGWSFTLGRN